MAVSPAARAAQAPAGMFAVSDWAWPNTTSLDREAANGLRSWRVSLDYAAANPAPGTVLLEGYDLLVRRMTARGIQPLFVVSGCPAWSCTTGGPPAAGAALANWKAFMATLVRRYGHGGSLWAAYPTAPYRPVTSWQVFNEVNGAGVWPDPSPDEYAAFLVATSATIKAADPEAKVVMAGLAEVMTVHMGEFLAGLYAQPGFKASFDVAAVHGYAPQPKDVVRILDEARVIMDAAGDTAKPIWVTEMSWATGGPPHPFVTTEAGQAANLRASWDTLLACSARWKLDRAYWFAWRDPATNWSDPAVSGSDDWGYHDGLLRPDGSAKPALAAFDEFTSGAVLPDGRGDTCTLPGGLTIDTTIPNTMIRWGPGVRTAVNRPNYRFASNESPVRYECHYEGSPWAACPTDAFGNWRPAHDLPGGTQKLYVRAVDAQGNVDPTPATYTTLVDRYPPDTYVAGVWGNVTTLANVLTLTASEPVRRYECRIDAAAWATCATPFTSTLTAGAHTVQVRAVDLAGNIDPDPASPWYQVRVP